MTLIFKPNGTLDVATSPADLPEKDGYSDAMARCKNLRLDRVGFAALRDGSTRLNSTALSGTRNWLP